MYAIDEVASRVRILALLMVLVAIFVAPAVNGQAVSAAQQERGLVFYGWGDQHVQGDGDYSHCMGAVEAFNAMPGMAYPEDIGGVVPEPSFVFNTGDLTEWPTHAAVNGYEEMIGKIRWPSFEISGNHDDGGKVHSETCLNWLREKHGALNYSFDAGGVHFTCLHTPLAPDANSPAGPVFPEALRFLRNDLATQPKEKPVVVAMHLCFDALTNRDEVVDAFEGHNVILVLAGHYHTPTYNSYRGINFVQLPSPKSKIRAVSVIRITPDRLVVRHYDYENKEWMDRAKVDVPIKWPPVEEYSQPTTTVQPTDKALDLPKVGVLYYEDFAKDAGGWGLKQELEGSGYDAKNGYGGQYASDTGCMKIVGKAATLGFIRDGFQLRPEKHVYFSYLSRAPDIEWSFFMAGVTGGGKYPKWGVQMPGNDWGLISLKSSDLGGDFQPGQSFIAWITMWKDNFKTAGWYVDNFMISYCKPSVLSVQSAGDGKVTLSWSKTEDITTGDKLKGYRITASEAPGLKYDEGQDVSGLLAATADSFACERKDDAKATYFTLWAELESGARWHGINQVKVGPKPAE